MCGSWAGCLTKSCAAYLRPVRALIFPRRGRLRHLAGRVMAAGASGWIAYAKAGVLDTVIDGQNGG